MPFCEPIAVLSVLETSEYFINRSFLVVGMGKKFFDVITGDVDLRVFPKMHFLW